MPSMWRELKNDNKPIVLYGMGDGAVKLLSILDSLGLSCAGIFASDDFVRYQSFMGYTVKKLSDIEEEISEFTILSAFATRLDSVIENFHRIEARHKLRIPDINVSGNHLELFDENFIAESYERIRAVYDKLTTDGKEFYETLISYKWTGELKYLDRLEELRTNFVLPYDASTITSFADFGAYIGDTVCEAVELYPSLKRFAAYEPDEKNFKKLEANTLFKGIERTLFNALVWDSDTTLVIRSGGAMNTIIEENITLDDDFQKKKVMQTRALTGDSSLPFIPDLIKMDIEGSERRAIDGCAEIISKHKPILRISIYHNHRDIFEIVEKIHALNPDYKFTVTQKFRYIPAWDIEVIAY